MMKTFILHQGIWKMKRHLGHITDEEWSIFALAHVSTLPLTVIVRSGLYSVNSCNLQIEKEGKEKEWKL